MSRASRDWITEAQQARKEAFETHRVAMKMECERLQRRLDELAEFYAPRIAIQDAGGSGHER